jgi:cytochrome c peroxidase
MLLLCATMAAAAGCAAGQKPTGPSQVAAPEAATPQGAAPQPGGTYHLQAFTPTGSFGNPLMGSLLFTNPVSNIFPQFVVTNGRSCATCHIAADGFALSAKNANARPSTDALITAVLADGDPDVDFNTPQGQALKAVMLDQIRNVGLIRIVMPMPNQTALMRTFRSVPTTFNSALGRTDSKTTSAGGTFTGFTMWDGREPSLEHQAGDATAGHAQGKLIGGGDVIAFLNARGATNDIASFEKFMTSNPVTLANLSWQLPQQNHALDGTPFEGAPIFDMATVQKKFFSTVRITTDAQRRGMFVFTGTPSKPACIVCHNMPETLAGGTQLFRSDNIAEENTQPRLNPPDANTKALMEAMGFNFLPDGRQQLPMQTLTLKADDGSMVTVSAPDAGLADQTGMLRDLFKYKVSQIRGIKSMKGFFHDHHEAELAGVVHHYESDFPELFNLTPAQESDLIEFLKAL